MATFGSAQEALLERIISEAGQSDTTPEDINYLGTTLLEIGGTLSPAPIPIMQAAQQALLNRIEVIADDPEATPEEISYLGTTLQLMGASVLLSEFQTARDSGLQLLFNAAQQAVLDISQVKDETTAYIESVRLNTADIDQIALAVKGYRDTAKTSETNAKGSETKAKTSESNAKTSETNAKTSETNAKTSETNASTSKDRAVQAETTADQHRSAAQTAKDAAVTARDLAVQAKDAAAASAASAANNDSAGLIRDHIADKNNPHAMTAAQVGAAPISHTHAVSQLSDASANARSLLTAANYAAMRTLLTLGNVNNTSDANKPISSAAQTALNAKADLVSGKIPESQLPAVAITDTFPVASQSEMLSLNAQRGDVAIRSDIQTTFLLSTEPATTLANWVELRSPTDPVQSVNGKIGNVILTTGDLGLINYPDDAFDLPVSDPQGAAIIAATKGFGVGADAPTVITNADAVSYSGLYRVEQAWVGSFAPDADEGRGFIEHKNFGPTNAFQKHTSLTGIERMRTKSGGAWSAWVAARAQNWRTVASYDFKQTPLWMIETIFDPGDVFFRIQYGGLKLATGGTNAALIMRVADGPASAYVDLTSRYSDYFMQVNGLSSTPAAGNTSDGFSTIGAVSAQVGGQSSGIVHGFLGQTAKTGEASSGGGFPSWESQYHCINPAVTTFRHGVCTGLGRVQVRKIGICSNVPSGSTAEAQTLVYGRMTVEAWS